MASRELSSPPDRRRFLGTLGMGALASCLPVETRALPAPTERTRLAEGFLLEPGLVYLQTASLGPSPRVVLDAARRAAEELERNPTHYGYGAHEQQVELVRAQAAGFLGVATAELSLTTSTTDGLNRVAGALALTLEPGDRILTTDQEHPGGRSCWEWVARTRGVTIDEVPIAPGPFDAEAFLAAVQARLTPRTRVLAMAHVLSSTGVRLPVTALCDAARARGIISVIDGAQAVGALTVRVAALGCDVYATSGHKWLLGPKGTGLLYVRQDAASRIPLITRQHGEAAYSGSTGVGNLPGLQALGAALRYLGAPGMQAVESHNLALRHRMAEALRGWRTLEVVSDDTPAHQSPMLSYRLPAGVPASALRQRLHERHQVYVKVVPGQWFNGHRLSFHVFNTDADVQRTVEALHAELD